MTDFEFVCDCVKEILAFFLLEKCVEDLPLTGSADSGDTSEIRPSLITPTFWETEVSVYVPFSESVVFLETTYEVDLGIVRAPATLRCFF